MGFFDDLVAQIAETRQPSGEVWFRGQADASWSLIPRILRSGISSDQEKNMLARWRYRAMGILAQHPSDNDPARWLFLMQHHGLPTRLLDWSESALSALFFAISTKPEADGRLFIFIPMELNQHQIGERVLIAPTMSPSADILVSSFKGSTPPQKIVAISAYASNDRLARQRGGFTVHGTAQDLQEIAPRGVLRSLVIPASSKQSLAEALAHLGITRTTLFYDLDALAWEMREQYGIA